MTDYSSKDPMHAPTAQPELGARAGQDRRLFIKGTGVAAAAAWLAPQIISVPAASAATLAPCAPTVVNWSTYATSIPSLNIPGPRTFDIGIGSLSTLRVTYSVAGITGTGSAQALYATTTPLGAETTNFIELSMQAGVTGDFQELILDFIGTPLTRANALTFRLLDVDLGTGFWQDQVRLSATLAAVPVLASSVVTGPFATATIVGPSNVVTGTTDPSGIGGGVPNNTTDANATVVYPTPVDRLVFRYTAANGTALQQMGISSLSFCLFE